MAFTFSLHYKRDSKTGSMTLLSNDDCRRAGVPAVHIYTTATTITGGIYTNQQNTFNPITVSDLYMLKNRDTPSIL